MARAKITRTQIRQFSDPREMPAYGIREAAHYLQIPVATLKSWVQGRTYDTRNEKKFFEPLIALPDRKMPLLSFYNLAEAHVLSVFRREYNIPVRGIRVALNYVQKKFGKKHPLIDQEFETHGASLFVRELDKVVDASADGQIMLDCIKAYLTRFDRDKSTVVRLWPFTRSTIQDSPRSVFIDPRISFGRPSLKRINVPTAMIAERYKAGDSIAVLSKDYGCDPSEIEEGLRCELDFQAAA